MSSIMHAAIDDRPAAVSAATAPPALEEHRVLSLDGVRGVAIMLVLYGHICESLVGEFGFSNPILNLGLLGWVGVDLFFVLSGFLITGILFNAKKRPHFYRNFYARRALRIFPLYYLALALVLAASALAPGLNVWGQGNPAWVWAYMTNFMLGFKGADFFGVVDHFWSLAVEEHYYLVWPTIVFFLNRRALMAVAGAALVVALLLRIGETDPAHGMSMAGYAFTPMRMDALAAGSLIALAVQGGSGAVAALRGPGLIAFFAGGSAFLAMVLWRSSISPHDPWLGTLGLTLLWVTFGGLIAMAIGWAPAARLLSAPVLRWFGKYSYGLYVWHPIIFIILVHTEWARDLRGGDTPWHAALWLSLAGLLTVAVALVSWHAWEKQFLKLKVRFA